MTLCFCAPHFLQARAAHHFLEGPRGFVLPCPTEYKNTEDTMSQNFQSLQNTVANQHGTRKPQTGFYVQPIAFGSNAAATDIIRTDRKSA